MAAGIGAGYLLRRRDLRHLGKIISMLIWLLLFLLGVEVGGDDRIVRGIGSLGVEAVIISVAGVLGSVVLAMALWRLSSGKAEKGRQETLTTDNHER